jgi:hypothetical protein
MGMMWLKDPDCVAKLDLVVKDSDVSKMQTDLEFAAKWLVLFLVVLAAVACTVLAFFRAARSGANLCFGCLLQTQMEHSLECPSL